jgi:hypothetical protein
VAGRDLHHRDFCREAKGKGEKGVRGMSKLQVKIDGELWERGKLFVCPDQEEQLELKITSLENTEVAKSFEQELRKSLGWGCEFQNRNKLSKNFSAKRVDKLKKM